MSLAFKKNLLTEVLSTHLNEQELVVLLDRWEHSHAHKSMYELNVFLGSLSDIPYIVKNRSSVYRTIIEKMHSAQRQIAPSEPEPLNLTTNFSPQTQEAINRVTLAVDLTQNMLETLSLEDAQSVCTEAASHLATDSVLAPLASWISVLQAKLSITSKTLLSPPQAQKFVNYFYTALCEVLGPVQADQILSQAIDETSRMHRHTEGAQRIFEQLLNR